MWGYIAEDVRGYNKMTRSKSFLSAEGKREKRLLIWGGSSHRSGSESQVALPTGQAAGMSVSIAQCWSPWRGWWLWLLGSIKESDTSISNQKPGKCLSPWGRKLIGEQTYCSVRQPTGWHDSHCTWLEKNEILWINCQIRRKWGVLSDPAVLFPFSLPSRIILFLRSLF